MSNMLGRSGPQEQRCCTRHSGRYRKSGKRHCEERSWRKEVEEYMESKSGRDPGARC